MNDIEIKSRTKDGAIDRFKLQTRLEVETKKVQGINRESFIDQRSLCSSCKTSSIFRRSSKNTRTLYCDAYSKNMPEDITECSAYAKVGSLSLGQMCDIAYLISDRSGRHQGYL